MAECGRIGLPPRSDGLACIVRRKRLVHCLDVSCPGTERLDVLDIHRPILHLRRRRSTSARDADARQPQQTCDVLLRCSSHDRAEHVCEPSLPSAPLVPDTPGVTNSGSRPSGATVGRTLVAAVDSAKNASPTSTSQSTMVASALR